jgi:hypothetical protein
MLWSLRYHWGRTVTPWLESLMSCYEVWDITWVALLRHDWNLWCHVMKFEISLGSHPVATYGWPLLWTFWQDCKEGSSLSSSVLQLLHMEIATFVIFVTLVNRRILKSWNYKITSLLTSGGRVLITPLCPYLPNVIVTIYRTRLAPLLVLSYLIVMYIIILALAKPESILKRTCVMS